MISDKYKKRIDELFSEIRQLAVLPDSELVQARHELDSLKARLEQLETQINEEKENRSPFGNPQENAPQASESQLLTPILYEKKKVAYLYSDQKLEPISANTIDEIKKDNTLLAPIVEGTQPMGAVVIEGHPEHPWSPDDAELADAVAQRASLQIQNLRLLAAAERARADALAATRRYTHESWQAFMDAIHESERIGFVYDRGAIEPYAEASPVDVDLQEAIPVMDDQVGSLFLKADPSHPLNEEDKALVSAIARQVGQQVENLRLLADAARARAEAEQATLRLTRDSWKAYMERTEETLGFVYDSNRVMPFAEQPNNFTLSQPLTVRGEPIGILAVADKQGLSKEEADLVAAIARQTSVHLETLRLNEELQRRAQELQELDRLKSAFLANMSHELRTPLNSILGFTDVILEGLDGDLTDNMQNDLGLIQKNGQHLLHLINDVLDMAKIESGRMNLHTEKFKVHDVLFEVMSITSTLASEKNLSLFIENDSDREIEVYADNTRLRQVMINLVNNSIKFTEKGKVGICAKKTDDAHVLIAVKDTGTGIPPDKLEAIFQEFAQVDTSTTRKVGGTGLGLPISRRLVEMHGGRLWAESTGVDGEGATFYVELPTEARISEVVEKTGKQ